MYRASDQPAVYMQSSLDKCVIVWGASSGVIMVCVYSSNT
jgi:hypothetical protein